MDDGDVTVRETAGTLPETAGPLVEPPTACQTDSAGVRRAVAELFEAHGEAVYGYCVRMVRDHTLAEDLMQQVFLEVCRDFQRFRGLSSWRTWLLGIATHRCVDVLRRRGATAIQSDRAVVEQQDPGMGPREHLDRAQLLAALDECLTGLSPEVRATVLMRFQTDLTYEQMAAHFHATPEALQMRVARAMPMLRACLERKGWAGERR